MRSFDKAVLTLSVLALAGCAPASKTGPAARPLALAVNALREQDQAAMDNAQDMADAQLARVKARAPNDPCAPAVRRAMADDAIVGKLNQPRMASFPDQARYLVAMNAVAQLGAPSEACRPQRGGGLGPVLDMVKVLVQSSAALDELAAWRADLRAGCGSEETFRHNMDQTATLLRDNGIPVNAGPAYEPPPTINLKVFPGWFRIILER